MCCCKTKEARGGDLHFPLQVGLKELNTALQGNGTRVPGLRTSRAGDSTCHAAHLLFPVRCADSTRSAPGARARPQFSEVIPTRA